MHTDIRRQIKREIEEHSKSGRNLEPVEEVDMGVEVRCEEELQQLCQEKAKITARCRPSPVHSYRRGGGVSRGPPNSRGNLDY